MLLLRISGFKQALSIADGNQKMFHRLPVLRELKIFGFVFAVLVLFLFSFGVVFLFRGCCLRRRVSVKRFVLF
jgi:hypothetical protein